jgi:hypothetical protein
VTGDSNHYLSGRCLKLEFFCHEGLHISSLHVAFFWHWFIVVTPHFFTSHPIGRLLLNFLAQQEFMGRI